MSSRFPKLSYIQVVGGNAADGLFSTARFDGHTLVGIIMPAAWTAGDLTFEASNAQDGTYQDVYDDNDAELTIQAAASRYIVIRPTTQMTGLGWVKVRSGTTATPVQQGASRTLTLVLRPVA